MNTAASSVAAAQPDYIAIAMVAVMALIVVVLVIRKHLALKKAAQLRAAEESTVSESVEAAPAQLAPGSAGEMKMYDVDPRTAAMLMAIVADQTGMPLNELRFISVREIK